MKKLAEEDVGL